jgi:hypothetical protein
MDILQISTQGNVFQEWSVKGAERGGQNLFCREKQRAVEPPKPEKTSPPRSVFLVTRPTRNSQTDRRGRQNAI